MIIFWYLTNFIQIYIIVVDEIYHTSYAISFGKFNQIPRNLIHLFDNSIITDIRLEKINQEKIQIRLFQNEKTRNT